MPSRLFWAGGAAFALSFAFAVVLMFSPPSWAGLESLGSAASVAAGAGLMALGVRIQKKHDADQRTARDKVWSTLADGLAKVAAGNLTWALKVPALEDPLAAECLRTFNDVTSEPCRRLFYVGSDSQAEGQLAGQVIGQRLGQGKLAVVLGSMDGINFELRRRGALTELRDNFPGVREVAVLESRVDPDHAYREVSRYLAAHPQVDAIYVTEGGSPPGVAKAVAEAGLAGRLPVFAHDVTPPTMLAMEQGIIQAAIFQDPYAQGYDPAVRLYNHLAAGEVPATPRLSTRIKSVTKDNSAEFWDSRSKRSLPGDTTRLVTPVPATGQSWKIAVVGMADDGFWAEVKAGVLAAKETLAPLGGLVDWVVPPGTDEPDRSAHLGETLRALGKDGYQGVALPLHERTLVPLVNEAVAAGIVIATYNTEPLSLRQTMTTVAAHAKHQLSLSGDLDTQAQKGKQSAQRIETSLSLVTNGLVRQKDQVSRTGADLETLGTTLKTIDAAARTSVEATQRVARSAEDSVRSVQESLGAMGGLESSSKAIGSSVDELKQETARIAENVAFIGDIANRTNILAINASIEAARAGMTGKGFAVIASEIRHLSDQANSAAASISRLLDSIGTKVDHVDTTTRAALEETRRTHESALVSGRALGVIVEASVESETKMGVILSAVQDVVSFSAQIEAIVKDLKETNEAWDSAVGDSMGAAGELTQVAQTIAQDAHALAERSRSQERMLRRFKLGEDE